MGNYILDGKEPKKCDDLVVWAHWFGSADRHVAKTEKGDILVSTVFLGIDHSIGSSPPLLFETMIFGGEHDQEMWHCSTWQDAEQKHQEACVLCGLT